MSQQNQAPEKRELLEPLIEQIIRFRIPVLIVIAAITAFMFWQMLHVEVDPAVESMMRENDPTNAKYQEFKEVFGHDEFGVVLYYDENGVFNDTDLEGIRRMTDAIDRIRIPYIKKHPAPLMAAVTRLWHRATGTEDLKVEDDAPPKIVAPIKRVLSLTNVDQVWGREWGMEVEPLIGDIPEDPMALKKLQAEAVGDELFEGVLVSKDGRTTSILFEMEPGYSRNDDIRLAEEAVRAIVAENKGGMPGQFRFLGTPVAKVRMVQLTNKDSATFFPLSVLSIVFFLFLIFRSLRGVLLPLAAVLIAFIWTMGMLVFTGQKFTLTSTTIIPLIQVYGVATVVHIFSHLSEGIEEHKNKVTALIHTCGWIAIPCFLTSVTTAIGFSSNAVSEIVPIRVAGLLTAFGVLCTYVIAFTLVPIALYYLPAKRQQERYTEGFVNRFMTWMLGRICRINQTHPKKVLTIWIAIGVAGILGVVNLKVETQTIKFLPHDDPIRSGYDFVEAHLGGITPIEVLVECEGQDCMYDPQAIKAMDQTCQWIVPKYQQVTKCTGYQDLIKKMNRAMNEGDPAYYSVPDDRALIAQYMLLFTGDASSQISENGDRARITVRIFTLPSPVLQSIIADLDREMAELLPEGYHSKATGGAVLYANMVNTLVNGQLESLGLAFFFILICMSVILRSVKVGLLSMIPNMIPIFFNFGLMGLTGITLNISTAMIASIAIGIAVDNTTHYLWRVNREFQKDGDYVASMERTINSVGRPMSYTAVIIIAGFLIIMAGSFIPNKHFGMLCGITMASAALADLFLTPVIVLLFRPLKRNGVRVT